MVDRPDESFPARADLPAKLSVRQARAVLKELRHHQAHGLLTLERGPTPRAPRNRRYFGQRAPWFIEVRWPGGTQRLSLAAWAEGWLSEDARRTRRAVFTCHRP